MDINEFAEITKVKIFRPGTWHKGTKWERTYTESDLDLMAANTSACMDYIRESQEIGKYSGNDGVNIADKPIPAFINLNHQEDLADTMRQAAKDISVKLYTSIENGVKWLMADLSNVPKDIAKFVKERYPLRSVEILPPIYHPGKQRAFSHVLRSISFLSPDKPPAVAGQANDFVVEYALTEGEIETYTINTEEVKVMDKQEKIETPPVNDAAIKEFQDALKAKDAELDAIRRELSAQRAKHEESEIKNYCDALVLSANKQPKCVTMDLKNQLMRLDNDAVLEFAEGAKQTAREWWMKYLADNLPTVPVGEFAAQQAQAQHQPKTAAEEIQEFAAQAKEQNPQADDRDLYLAQVRLWTASKKGGK